MATPAMAQAGLPYTLSLGFNQSDIVTVFSSVNNAIRKVTIFIQISVGMLYFTLFYLVNGSLDGFGHWHG
jgi:hypothetical protein